MLELFLKYLCYCMGDASECERFNIKFATTGKVTHKENKQRGLFHCKFLDNMAGKVQGLL